MSANDTVTLDAAQRAQSARLTALIVAEIAASGGWLRFDRYMATALYAPGLGYYSAGAVKLGPDGDFVTAPELSDALANALAALFAPLLAKLTRPTLLELGAGTGRLALRLLERLTRLGIELDEYRILEPSPDLRERQQVTLAASPVPVTWLDGLPDVPLDGIVFGNEVADALPVVPFIMSAGRARPLGVVADGGRLEWQPGPADAELEAAVARIEAAIGRSLPDGYRSEVCLLLAPWISSLAATIGRGGLMLIDYGLPAREYYHPDRNRGTLICHLRHRAHDDPFLVPGLQDITAWVDFSAVAAAARTAGLELAGFTTQGQFLVEVLAADGGDALGSLSPAEQSALKTLLLPGEMGERFKLIWLTRGDAAKAIALPGRDFRGWL